MIYSPISVQFMNRFSIRTVLKFCIIFWATHRSHQLFLILPNCRSYASIFLYILNCFVEYFISNARDNSNVCILFSVTILDHHKTAFESLCGNATVGKNVNKVIDMQRSGATIAFDFFSNKLLAVGSSVWNHGSDNAVNGVKYLPDNKLETVHKLFKFIEDGDLWRWTIPNSKPFSSGLKDLDIEFDVNINRKMFDQLLELDPEKVISHGQATLSHKQKLIDDCLEKSYEIALGRGRFGNCLAVNADAISNLRSELGNQLADKSRNLNLRSIGAVVYKVPELNDDNMLKISLRSLNEEDTATVSKEYGGGGHRNASSFLLSVTEFDRWKAGAEDCNTKM
ncbi:hypothetical protein E2562_019285 [Oryza meyeriana var. granulata]|uniref:DHHA1 domain-containing protein n=1 Tax=Oryza meyeriana var. granulata TaxID=110450 RepID=A0A6G1FAF0_9ORYZ|nr:hypothetical protein E2562_019285 [Oryza meyeriana var. granulata]